MILLLLCFFNYCQLISPFLEHINKPPLHCTSSCIATISLHPKTPTTFKMSQGYFNILVRDFIHHPGISSSVSFWSMLRWTKIIFFVWTIQITGYIRYNYGIFLSEIFSIDDGQAFANFSYLSWSATSPLMNLSLCITNICMSLTSI